MVSLTQANSAADMSKDAIPVLWLDMLTSSILRSRVSSGTGNSPLGTDAKPRLLYGKQCTRVEQW